MHTFRRLSRGVEVHWFLFLQPQELLDVSWLIYRGNFAGYSNNFNLLNCYLINNYVKSYQSVTLSRDCDSILDDVRDALKRPVN